MKCISVWDTLILIWSHASGLWFVKDALISKIGTMWYYVMAEMTDDIKLQQSGCISQLMMVIKTDYSWAMWKYQELQQLQVCTEAETTSDVCTVCFKLDKVSGIARTQRCPWMWSSEGKLLHMWALQFSKHCFFSTLLLSQGAIQVNFNKPADIVLHTQITVRAQVILRRCIKGTL